MRQVRRTLGGSRVPGCPELRVLLPVGSLHFRMEKTDGKRSVFPSLAALLAALLAAILAPILAALLAAILALIADKVN